MNIGIIGLMPKVCYWRRRGDILLTAKNETLEHFYVVSTYLNEFPVSILVFENLFNLLTLVSFMRYIFILVIYKDNNFCNNDI